MLCSGTFSCGNGGRGHVVFWDIFLWDCCLLEFSSKRVVAASKWVPRNDFCDGSILSEQIYPSAKTFWNSYKRKSQNQNPQERGWSDEGRGHVVFWDIFLWEWGKGPCCVLGHFLVGMGEGAMLSSGTFSCGIVVFWNFPRNG